MSKRIVRAACLAAAPVLGALALAALAPAFAPAAAGAAEPAPRTLALVDFAVRAGGQDEARSAWLGGALAELMQAKMQLFAGATVVERRRLDLAFARGGATPGQGEMDAPRELALVPAQVLVAGSVSVAPGGDGRRIRVMARAVETETGRVLSQTAFSGQDDLAGLLALAAQLAAALADGLGLSYTPAQLAYAEPARVDALQRHVEGLAHLRAGRHAQAIAALGAALEDNGGRYFAAAHRALGDAYQARIEAQQAAEAEATRAEYLERFRRDALLASGALFDLAVAYAASGLHREAGDAFRDYIAAVGDEGETVRWSFELARDLVGAALPPGIDGGELGAYFSHRTAFALGDGRLRFLHGPGEAYEVAVDVATGRLAGVARVTDPAAAAELRPRRDAPAEEPPPPYRGGSGHDLPLLARSERFRLYLESPVLLLVDAATGDLVAKYRTDEGTQGRAIQAALFVGDDVLVAMGNQRPGADGGRLQRLHLAPRSGVVVTPVAVARLHLAGALVPGDLAGARAQLALAEAELPGDPRAMLLRARIAAAAGERREAARQALRALLAGGVGERELPEVETFVRGAYPRLRRIVPTALRRGFSLVSLADPATLVVRTYQLDRAEHHRLDVATGETAPIPLEGLAPLRFAGGGLLAREGFRDDAATIRVDLLTGERAPAAAPAGPSTHLAWAGGGVEVFYEGDPPRQRPAGEREEVRLLVAEEGTGRLLGRFAVTLARERLLGVAADASSLVVAVGSFDEEAYFAGEGTALRVEHFPLAAGGRAWTYRAEGWLAGSPALEGDAVVFLAHEGKLPLPEGDGLQRIAAGLPLARVSLDRAGGDRLGARPHAARESSRRSAPPRLFDLQRDPRSVWNWNVGLGGLFVPNAPRRIFAGRDESVYDTETALHRLYWFYAPGKDPALVEGLAQGDDYTLVARPAPCLVRGDTVYEALGAGFLAEKAFDGGAGVESISSVVR